MIPIIQVFTIAIYLLVTGSTDSRTFQHRRDGQSESLHTTQGVTRTTDLVQQKKHLTKEHLVSLDNTGKIIQSIGGFTLDSKIRDLGLVVKYFGNFDYPTDCDDSMFHRSMQASSSSQSMNRHDNVIDHESVYLLPSGDGNSDEYGFQPENKHRIQILDRISVAMNNNSCLRKNGTYYLSDNIFRGGHGEVWRAYKVSSDGFLLNKMSYIIKRMHIGGTHGQHILACAWREIYFGSLFRDHHITMPVARFVRHFHEGDDFYLVFRDEGISLQKLLYTTSFSESASILESSLIWKKLRTTPAGTSSFRGILYQVMT